MRRTLEGPVSLGDLIKALEGEDPKMLVHYDFGYFRPTCLASYRGYYNQLALGYDAGEYGDPIVTVAGLLMELKAAIGKTFTGWKGGEYVMGTLTPVWVANRGDAPGVGIIGVKSTFCVYLLTEHLEW